MLVVLAVLAVTVIVSVPLARTMGRWACLPIAALYLVATAALWPVSYAVWSGERPTWSMPWVPEWGVDLALRADGLGVMFALLATVIGALVFAYSAWYLGPGRHVSFALVMTLFTLAMVGLVLADDLVLLFICWELTSLSSFLLIARSGRAGEAASMRTLLLTFIGGVALLVAVGLIIARTGTTSVSVALADPAWTDSSGSTLLVAALVAVAGFSKAAQFPFHVWLPDAMAAATPVSAYLHAAAVVKAGIFLLLRFSPAFHDTWLWNLMLLGAGLVTALIGARFALQQTDLKRLMAYSTVSQLGLIVATIGVGTADAMTAATVHTVAHALFKSGLFMVVGIIDHGTGTRDLRRLPPLWQAMPASFGIALVGVASMAGIPPLLGFVSKESVFHALYHAPGPAWTGPVALGAAAIASVMTFLYCAKILLGGFVDGPDADRGLRPVAAPMIAVTGLPILAGLPLGLWAGVLDRPIASASDAALPGAGEQVHLMLWHGINVPLLATAAVLATGAVLALVRRRLWPLLERPTLPFDGPAVIAALAQGQRRLGVRIVQLTGVLHPSRHLAAIAASYIAVVAGGALAVMSSQQLPDYRPGWGTVLDTILLVLMAAAVFAVCRSTSRLSAVVALSAVGILATVQLISLGAPDVGQTQLLVEALTVIVIMLVLQRLPRSFEPRRSVTGRLSAIVIAVGGGLAATVSMLLLTGRRDRSPVGLDLYRTTEPLTGGTNVVNVILVEFRALDTFGEMAVLGMAGIVLVALLSTVRSQHLDPHTEHEQAVEPLLGPPGSPSHRAITVAWPNAVRLQLVLRVAAPVLALVSALLFLRGHTSPGGGFVAALVGSCIVGLVYLSTSRDRQIGPPALPLHLIGGGVLFATLVGVWGLVAKGSFLYPLHAEVGGVHLSSSVLFDAGIYAAVLGLILAAFNLLGLSESTYQDPQGEETRERVDEMFEGELEGPLDSVRGEDVSWVGAGTTYVARGQRPREPGR